MGRKEGEIREREHLEAVLKTVEVGYLAFNGLDGWPRITPVNFVFDGRILWHGAMAGERFLCLRSDPRATFSAVSLHLYFPSHFTSEEDSTTANMAFKSVQARG